MKPETRTKIRGEVFDCINAFVFVGFLFGWVILWIGIAYIAMQYAPNRPIQAGVFVTIVFVAVWYGSVIPIEGWARVMNAIDPPESRSSRSDDYQQPKDHTTMTGIAREGKEKQVVGPHVVEPVHSPIEMHSTVRDIHGHFEYQWECKYCGEKNLTIEEFAFIHKDCDGIEWIESELFEFKERESHAS